MQGADLIDNKQVVIDADMVVLATAIEPDPSVRRLATMLTASIDTNNFLTEAHPKLRPVESPTAGVFLSGVCQGQKTFLKPFLRRAPAAVKAIGLLAKDKLTTNPCTAKSDELLCNGCSACANVCPYGAITYEEKQVNDHGIREIRRVAVVNNALCQGCGACTVTCPSGAMDLQGFSNRQISRRWMPYAGRKERRIQAENCRVLLQLVQLCGSGSGREQPGWDILRM